LGIINSQGANGGLKSVLHTRINQAVPGRETTPAGLLRSGQADESLTEASILLSSQVSNGMAEGLSNTYSHLEKKLTADQLDINDIRGSLSQLQDLVGGSTSFVGTRRIIDHAAASYDPIHAKELDDSRSYRAKGDGQLFTLTITTADGDRIELEISNTKGTEGSLSDGDYYGYSDTTINFKVDGDLDAGELEALGALTNELGGFGDAYRDEGWLTLGGIDAFDQSELTGFSLKVLGEDTDSFSLEYKVDLGRGQHSLSSKLNGYVYDITLNLDGLKLDKNVTNNAQYLQYQQLIRDTSHSYQGGVHAGGVSSGKAASFFLDGMDTLFNAPNPAESDVEERLNGVEEVTKPDVLQPALRGINGNNAALLDTFSSGLADFKASFKTPEFRPNADQASEISNMSLDIAQTTEVSYSVRDGHRYTELNQKSEYQSQVRQHLGLAGDSVKHANLGSETDGGQSYLYRTDLKSAMTSRSLNFQDNSKLLSVDEIRRQQHIQKEKLVVQGKVESNTTEDLSSVLKNTVSQIEVANTPREQRLAKQYLSDYRTIEQLNEQIDGNEVELFL